MDEKIGSYMQEVFDYLEKDDCENSYLEVLLRKMWNAAFYEGSRVERYEKSRRAEATYHAKEQAEETE